MRGFLKYLILFVVACACSIAMYYSIVPEESRTPMSIEIKKN